MRLQVPSKIAQYNHPKQQIISSYQRFYLQNANRETQQEGEHPRTQTFVLYNSLAPCKGRQGGVWLSTLMTGGSSAMRWRLYSARGRSCCRNLCFERHCRRMLQTPKKPIIFSQTFRPRPQARFGFLLQSVSQGLVLIRAFGLFATILACAHAAQLARRDRCLNRFPAAALLSPDWIPFPVSFRHLHQDPLDFAEIWFWRVGGSRGPHQRKFRSSNFRLYWKLPVALAPSMFSQQRCFGG